MKQTVIWIVLCLCAVQLLEAQMYDPFRKTAKSKPVSGKGLLPPPPMVDGVPVVPMVVSAIMNNKAYINGSWYGIGERINNKEITYIQNNFVGLKEGNRLTMISVSSNRHVLGTKDLP